MAETTYSGAGNGYTRYEFSRIFQIYSRNVYAGLFRDFSFVNIDGKWFISFKEDAAHTPLVTIEKRRLGPDKALFIATMPGVGGTLKTVARSEKIDAFVTDLAAAITRYASITRGNRAVAQS